MRQRGPDIEAAIGSLDLATTSDPPDGWRPTCDKLRDALAAGRRMQLRFAIVPIVIAFAAFVMLEWRSLDAQFIVLISACAIAAVGARVLQKHKIGGLLWLAALVLLIGLSLALNLYTYVALAMGVGIGINFILTLLYPALQHEDRIDSVLAYFDYPPVPKLIDETSGGGMMVLRQQLSLWR